MHLHFSVFCAAADMYLQVCDTTFENSSSRLVLSPLFSAPRVRRRGGRAAHARGISIRVGIVPALSSAALFRNHLPNPASLVRRHRFVNKN